MEPSFGSCVLRENEMICALYGGVREWMAITRMMADLRLRRQNDGSGWSLGGHILCENLVDDLHSIRRTQRSNPLSAVLSANHFNSTNDGCFAIASPK